jgi:regulator of protease activity HflC (stomatin/prohibitin superfamily)
MEVMREAEARIVAERIAELGMGDRILSDEALARIPTCDTKLGGNEIFCIRLANCIKCICSVLFFPYFCVMAASDCFYSVEPMKASVFKQFGKPARVQKKPGCYCKYQVGCGFTEYVEVDLRIKSQIIEGRTVPDKSGAPMEVQCLLNYVISDPVASLFTVADLNAFIVTQSYDVVRRVCGKFMFKTKEVGEPSLTDDSVVIAERMGQLLAKRLEFAGIKVLRFDFIELQYRAEVTS